MGRNKVILSQINAHFKIHKNITFVRERERQIERDRERQRDRGRGRDTERDTERERQFNHKTQEMKNQ